MSFNASELWKGHGQLIDYIRMLCYQSNTWEERLTSVSLGSEPRGWLNQVGDQWMI